MYEIKIKWNKLLSIIYNYCLNKFVFFETHAHINLVYKIINFLKIDLKSTIKNITC